MLKHADTFRAMKKIILICLGILLICGCNQTGGSNVNVEICGGSRRGCIIGRVVNSLGGGGIGEALIKVEGNLIATANAQGWFFGKGIEEGESVSVCFEATGFVTTCRRVAILALKAVSLTDTEMVPDATIHLEDVQLSGADILDPNTGLEFRFSAGSLCEDDRITLVNGDVECSLITLDIMDDDIELAPGDFTADDGTTVGSMRPSAVISTVCWQNGAMLDVCDGSTMYVRLPVFGTEDDCLEELVNPLSVVSWYFDLDEGLWKSYSVMSRNCGSTAAERYYQGVIDRLGWWSGGVGFTPTCIKGSVVDDQGNPMASVEILCRGVSYYGVSTAYTGSNSSFCTEVKPDEDISCFAAKGSFSSIDATGTAPDTVARCSGGTSSCASLGEFSVTNTLFRTLTEWNDEGLDLNAHFVGEGIHVFFGSKGSLTSSPYVRLETESSSLGPEIISAMPSITSGTYYFCVRNASGESKGKIAESEAEVTVLDTNISELYKVSTSNPNDFDTWRVFKAVIDDAGAVTLTEINEFVDGSTSVVDACGS
jgi:hypothetical protein